MTHPRQSILRACALCLMSLPALAFAQWDYEVHGVADFSYGRFEPSGFYRTYRFNSNSLTPSFVGGSVRYGLDGGWAVGVNLESFYRFQELRRGRNNDDPRLSRNNFAFVNGPLGNVRVGRLQSYLFDTTNRFNALGNSVSFSPAVRHLFFGGNLMGTHEDFYWDESVSYTSPNLRGFTVNLMQSRGDAQTPGSLSGANVVWQKGVFAVALSGQRIYINNLVDDPTSERVWQLGASYNFGYAKLFGLHTQKQDAGLRARSRLSSAGINVPFGPGSVVAQFGVARAQGMAIDRKQRTMSGGYIYPLEHDIDLYVLFMDDRVEGQTPGAGAAMGVRWRFQ